MLGGLGPPPVLRVLYFHSPLHLRLVGNVRAYRWHVCSARGYFHWQMCMHVHAIAC